MRSSVRRWFSAVTFSITFFQPAPQSAGRHDAMRSGRFVRMKNRTSGRAWMMSHTSARHGSAPSTKKSDVMQMRMSSPARTL